MWYRTSDVENQTQEEIENGIDYKLISSIAKKIIKEHLYLKGDYNPDTKKIDGMVKKIIDALENKYTRLELVRGKTSSEYLTPLIEKTIDTVF